MRAAIRENIIELLIKMYVSIRSYKNSQIFYSVHGKLIIVKNINKFYKYICL